MNETGSGAALSEEADRFETETMAVLSLSITQEPETLPMMASLHKVGDTGTLLIWASWFNPIKLAKFWPQHRAV